MYHRKIAKMDLDKMLRHVNNLNDYISVTQEVIRHKSNSSKVQFNMSTVLLLKKVRSLEIEYFNKCEGNGAALVLFERMVDQPPSKTWGLLGKELVLLLQYWLDAMRKHLIRHSHNWWIFLKLLLKFIKNIRVKDRSLPDILVEETTECLLDLATSSQPSTLQRHEVLCCLNLCCAESSREIRFALRNKFESYFCKLGSVLVSCGHLPAQYSALETLLRWLLPRQAAGVRLAAAKSWFPDAACGRKALDLFLERPWMDFFQDARAFLCACNEATQRVSSAPCRALSLGQLALTLGTEKRCTWLDVNVADRSVSLVLEARLLDALGVAAASWETLLVPEDEVLHVRMFRESSEVTLALTTSQAPRLCPSDAQLSDACELTAVLSSSSNLQRLDSALRQVFGDKYQILLDLDAPISLSPREDINSSKQLQSSLEEDTRFSHPVEVRRRKHSGFIVRPRYPVAWQSPSTASTTSLAQLHEKLESLPQYKFDKEAVHVCALPELSTVTEVSETDDRQSLLGHTLKINRPVGISQKNFNTDRKSQRDGEVQSKSKVNRYLSPIEKEDEQSTNCLLVATVGSAEESVINDTLERLAKNKDYRSDNIVDLLVQEALQKDFNDREFLDSGINTGDNTKKTQNVNEVNSVTIENTPLEKINLQTADTHLELGKNCTVISNTTTDESNDVVCETPKNFVTIRKRNMKINLFKEKGNVIVEESEGQIFDVNTVEEFFSQHIAENRRGEIVISPTLARKINESSSESESFEDCLIMEEGMNVEQIESEDIEIVECLNSMVDRVVSDFEKCTDFLNRNSREIDVIVADNAPMENPPDVIPLTDVGNVQNCIPDKEDFKRNEAVPKKPIKLKYTAKKTKTAKARTNMKKKNNKLQLEPASEMSPAMKHDLYAQDDINTPERKKNMVQSPKTDSPTSKSGDKPLIRRKRKLYSPKYENIESEKMYDDVDENIDLKTSKLCTPKYKSTCYKDIETERKKRIRQPRAKKSKPKSETPSPRTKKRNYMFDQLKEKLECPVTVIAADKKTEKDMAVYNFTSDSEDEDFKKKKIEVQKRISSTTIASGDSSMSTRKVRNVNRVNYSENKSSDETVKKTSAKQKRTLRRKRTPRTRIAQPVNELVDEKMRNAKADKLNTSLTAIKHSDHIIEEPELLLVVNPKMEAIPDEVVIKDINEKHKKTNKKQKKAETLSLKKEKNANTLSTEQDNDDRTISPLPGLVIETMPSKEEDANDSVCATMLQKLKKMHEDGPEEFNNETNTTQNLLSDVERTNHSPIPMNISDELNKFESKVNYDSKIVDDNIKSFSKSLKAKNEERIFETTNITRVKKEISEKRKQENCPVINLSDTKSEKSIATVGKSPITAHGDSDEAPPHSELLTERLKPRDLEIEYLDQSMKDYFHKLRSEVDNLPAERRQSNDSVSSKVHNLARGISTDKSPIVSIKKLSLDDISKWLPSPRQSDTYSRCSEDSNNARKVTKQINTTNAKEQFDKDSSDEELNYPSKKKDQIERGNTNIRRSNRAKTKPVFLQYDYSTENNSDCDVSRHNSSNFKWLRSHGDIDPETNNSEYNNDDLANNIGTNVKTSKKGNEERVNRKSMISPINFFEELSSKKSKSQKSPILRQKSSFKRQESSINCYESEVVEKEKVNEKRQMLADADSKRNRKNKLKFDKEKKSIRVKATTQIDGTSDTEETLARNELEARRKRKTDSPEISYSKKKKVDVAMISDSGPSVSSVDEWFRRNMPVNRAEGIDTSLRDNIQSVLEKLDTTLVEIHQNTSKSFIHLFVDAQSRLAEVNRERRAMLKTAASEILAQVVTVIDDKFAELDRRSLEMHSEFTQRLKTQASALIRADCSKKQALVSLLREDLAASLARLDASRASQ